MTAAGNIKEEINSLFSIILLTLYLSIKCIVTRVCRVTLGLPNLAVNFQCAPK